MGIYFRKSISVGPFRFNLSKNGVGVSAGIKGLRVGTGPRGNYVHMGAAGIYYRTTFSSPKPQIAPEPTPQQIPSEVKTSLSSVDNSDISTLVDSSSEDLLREIREKDALPQYRNIALLISAIALLFALKANAPIWLVCILVVGSMAGVIHLHRQDRLRKIVVLFYELEATQETAYEKLITGIKSLKSAQGLWSIDAQGDVSDRKYHGGASTLVARHDIQIKKEAPPFLETNIEVYSIEQKNRSIYFFPDRILIFAKKNVGALHYNSLSIASQAKKFIESEKVPGDAAVVDQTWEYVNKSGGPDKRFKNNRRLPVCLYEEIAIEGPNGFMTILQLSKLGVGKAFCDCISSVSPRS